MNSTTGETENSSSNSSNEDFYYNYYCCDPADLHYSYSDDSKTSTAVNQGAVLDSSLVVRDVDVEEYVQHVYGISQADLAYIHSKEWELEGLSAYTEQLDMSENEDALCEPFKNIMGNLFKTLVDDGRKLDIHHVSLGTKGRKGAAKARNPDQLFFFGSPVDKMPIKWSLSKAFVEVVVTPMSQRLREFELSQKTGALGEEGTATAGSAPDASIPDLLASPASTPRRRNVPQINNATSASPLLVPTINPTPAPPVENIDFETLGGCLTFENFMAALGGSQLVGIPKKYQAYAKSLLESPKPKRDSMSSPPMDMIY
ncbi:hypothetical protein EYR38_010470 [Pleurotus pulmonarius]|nr:hypothetical protein EYR38_010470 [Pleurotus pulmonarius]